MGIEENVTSEFQLLWEKNSTPPPPPKFGYTLIKSTRTKPINLILVSTPRGGKIFKILFKKSDIWRSFHRKKANQAAFSNRGLIRLRIWGGFGPLSITLSFTSSFLLSLLVFTKYYLTERGAPPPLLMLPSPSPLLCLLIWFAELLEKAWHMAELFKLGV